MAWSNGCSCPALSDGGRSCFLHQRPAFFNPADAVPRQTAHFADAIAPRDRLRQGGLRSAPGTGLVRRGRRRDLPEVAEAVHAAGPGELRWEQAPTQMELPPTQTMRRLTLCYADLQQRPVCCGRQRGLWDRITPGTSRVATAFPGARFALTRGTCGIVGSRLALCVKSSNANNRI